ncbi:MAG: signal transduction histidine kinase/CheY-like chemotaxis protein [bacterium]|jgi:signal transduction histidine kinase/CheY-like chemotaxis protein
MTIFFKTQIKLLFNVVCFFILHQFNAQEVKQDTLSQIYKHQTKAKDALLAQDFESAIINLNEATKLVINSEDNIIKADIHLNFAELQYHIHNYKKADAEILNAITHLKKEKNQLKLGQAYNFYGLVLTKLKDYIKAEAYLKDADAIFTSLNNEKNQAITIYYFGILELEKNNTSAAINYFEATLPLLKSNNLKYKQAELYLWEADAFLKLNNSNNNNNLLLAKTAFSNYNLLVSKNSFLNLKTEGYRVQSLIAARDNKPQEASTLLNKYLKEKDSLYTIYIQAISKSSNYDSNIGDKDEIIASQQEEIDKKNKSINFGKMTTGLSIALIIILSLLALSLFKNNNLRAKANDLLKDKNIELTLAKEKAERASLAKAQFLSTITHELRTPLYAVTGLTHLLLEEDPTPNQKEHLNSLKFSGEYLLSLINNILDLNKLEANKVEIEKTTFSLRKRINDVLIALKKTAEDRKNSLTFEYDESIPKKLIGDPLKLSQVLINLIGNSVKFTQNGDVTIRVNKLNSTKDKVNLHVEIEDTGVGISKKKQKSIFETFNQGSLQINRKFGGSGLGLSIVKNLLELMNSKINLESVLGQGSKFWFDISFNISEETFGDTGLSNKAYNIDYKSLENVSILVVEDNKINQMITKKILEKHKIVCKVADNGLDAIKMVHENDFKLILMDIHMPGISGIETTQQIREFDKQLPIIALTAVTIDENLDEFYKAGFNEIIPKPFKPEDFFEKISNTLKASKTKIS